MARKITCICLILILLAGLLAGCAPNQPEDDRLRVVASIFPEYDFARAIAGGLARVDMLIAPGASIHTYDPSPVDILTIQRADIFLYVGGESDVWADRLLASLDKATARNGFSHMTALRLMDHVKLLREEHREGMSGHEEGDGEDAWDEHIWTSPKNAMLLMEAIRDAMCAADPVNAAAYTENAAAYMEQLAQVDREIMEIAARAKRRTIVVADRFPFLYFVRDYGLDYAAAFPGCSDQTDAGADTLRHLIHMAKQIQAPYIYRVELSNDSFARTVADAAGAGVLLLNSCHNVTKEEFDAGITYIDLMRQNAENLRLGLH